MRIQHGAIHVWGAWMRHLLRVRISDAQAAVSGSRWSGPYDQFCCSYGRPDQQGLRNPWKGLFGQACERDALGASEMWSNTYPFHDILRQARVSFGSGCGLLREEHDKIEGYGVSDPLT